MTTALPTAPASSSTVPSVRVDLEGIEQRVVEVPVPEARYEAIFALKNKLLLFSSGQCRARWNANWSGLSPSCERRRWRCYDLVEDRRETWLTDVADLVLSGDRSRLAYTTSAPDRKTAGASGW